LKKIFISILSGILLLFTSYNIVSADQEIKTSINSNGQDTITINVENQQERPLENLSYQLDLPAGYELVDKLPTLQELGSHQTHKFDVKIKKTSKALPSTGETWSKYTLIGILIISLLLVAYYLSKTRKFIFFIFFIVSLLGIGGFVKAAPTYKEFSVSHRISLFDNKIPVTLHIYFEDKQPSKVDVSKQNSGETHSEEVENQEKEPSQPTVSEKPTTTPVVPSQPTASEKPTTTPVVPSQPTASEKPTTTPVVPSQPTAGEDTTTTPVVPSQPTAGEDTTTTPRLTPPEEILISGYAISGTTNKALEETNITISAPNIALQTVETENDGYFYTHLIKGLTYTLVAKDFKVRLTANSTNNLQIENILGRFSAGKQTIIDSGEVILQPSVAVFDTIVDYTVSDKEHHVTLAEERKLNSGDIIVLPANGTYPSGFAFKVISSNIVNGKTEIVVTDAKLDEVTKNISYHEKFDVDQATFKPAEGVTVTEEGSDQWNRSVSISATKKLHTRISGIDVDLIIKGSVEADIQLVNNKLYVKPALDIELSSKYNAKATINAEVKVGELVFTSQTGVNIQTELYLFVNASGSLDIKTKSNFGVSAEIGLKDKNPYYVPNISLNNKIDVDMNALLKIGPKTIIRPRFLNLSIVSFDTSVGLGLEGQFHASVTQKNTENPILDKASGKVLLFGDYTMGYNIDAWIYKGSGKFIENKRFFEIPISKGEYSSKATQASHYHNIDNNIEGETTSSNTISNTNSHLYSLKDYPFYKRLLEDTANNSGRNASFTRSVGRPVTYTLYDINQDGLPELIFLADNHPISVWTWTGWTNQNPHPDVARVADIAEIWGSTTEQKLTIYQDGTIVKFYDEKGFNDKIDKKHYEIVRKGVMGPFTDKQYYESSWTTDFAYFYNVNNIDEHISLADLNTKYIKSPEVDFSKYPQNILRDYYGDKTFTPYLSKTVDLTKWLGYKYLLEDLSQSERDSQQTGVGGLASNLKPLINSPVQYAFYDIDGNGTPELIFKASDIILSIVTSTVQTRQESASGIYGKGNITYLEFSQPPLAISVNPQSPVYYFYDNKTRQLKYSRTDGGIKIYKDGTIRYYAPDPELQYSINKRANQRTIAYYRINKDKAVTYLLGYFQSNRENGLENYYNLSNTEHYTLDELDQNYIHSEEIDYNSLVWKNLVDFNSDNLNAA